MSRNGFFLSFSFVLLWSKDFLSYPQQSGCQFLLTKTGSHVHVAEEATRVNIRNLSTANVIGFFWQNGRKRLEIAVGLSN